MLRTLMVLVAVVLAGCTTTITEVVEVYPTELTIVSTLSATSVGETLGLGANASILGKKELSPQDSMSVTVRDQTVLRVVADFRGQQFCSSGVCVHRWVDLRALKPGETFVVFRVHDTADSVKVTVHQPKG